VHVRKRVPLARIENADGQVLHVLEHSCAVDVPVPAEHKLTAGREFVPSGDAAAYARGQRAQDRVGEVDQARRRLSAGLLYCEILICLILLTKFAVILYNVWY